MAQLKATPTTGDPATQLCLLFVACCHLLLFKVLHSSTICSSHKSRPGRAGEGEGAPSCDQNNRLTIKFSLCQVCVAVRHMVCRALLTFRLLHVDKALLILQTQDWDGGNMPCTWWCRGLFRNWREVCCLLIPRRKPEPMLMPDLEMGHTDQSQQEAIPALSGPTGYQQGQR